MEGKGKVIEGREGLRVKINWGREALRISLGNVKRKGRGGKENISGWDGDESGREIVSWCKRGSGEFR